MKKLTTISLFIFGVVVIAILVAGLIFYQNKKDSQVINNQTGSKVSDTINQITSSDKSIILSMEEISKHNKETDCWYLISGKVYNITSYFGLHPGGNSTMVVACGKDATITYNTQDPYATSNSRGRTAHSSRAVEMLGDYYLGDLGQTIGEQKITETTTTFAPKATNTKWSDNEDEWEDD